MNLKTVFFTILLTSFCAFSQGTINILLDSALIGEELRTYVYTDLITYHEKEVLSPRLVDSDEFQVSFPLETTRKVRFEIGNIFADIYCEPGKEYTIYMQHPPEYYPGQLTMQVADMRLVGIDSTDLNFNLIQLTNWVRNFEVVYDGRFSDSTFLKTLGEFEKTLDEDYAFFMGNEFFMIYLEALKARLESKALEFGQRSRKFSEFVYKRHIHGKPLNFQCEPQVRAIEKQFTDYTGKSSRYMVDSLRFAVFYRSPYLFKKYLEHDELLAGNPRLQEWVITKFVLEEVFLTRYPQHDLLELLDSVNLTTKFPDIKEFTEGAKSKITTIGRGSAAPQYVLRSSNKTWDSLIPSNGKPTYIHFYRTNVPESVNQITALKELYKRYNKYVNFVSVNLDKDTLEFYRFSSTSQAPEWTNLHWGNQRKLIEEYQALSLPLYVLINENGIISQIPARLPVADGEYRTIDEIFFYIKKRAGGFQEENDTEWQR